MDNNVVGAICQRLQEENFATLRFNFRGVGRSQGTHGQGVGEQDDVHSALAFLQARDRVDGERLGLAGYSFGAAVALNVAPEEEKVMALALISLPLNMDDPSPLESYNKPKLLISGSADGFIPFEDVLDLTARLPEPKSHEIVPNADHFWWGHEHEVASRVTSFFAQHLK